MTGKAGWPTGTGGEQIRRTARCSMPVQTAGQRLSEPQGGTHSQEGRLRRGPGVREERTQGSSVEWQPGCEFHLCLNNFLNLSMLLFLTVLPKSQISIHYSSFLYLSFIVLVFIVVLKDLFGYMELRLCDPTPTYVYYICVKVLYFS